MESTTYKVTMEDGSGWETVSDQRDIARWEREPFGTSWSDAVSKLFTYSRYRAWRGSRRAKQYAGTWEEWEEACVHVEAAEEEEDASDPGQPAASAGI